MDGGVNGVVGEMMDFEQLQQRLYADWRDPTLLQSAAAMGREYISASLTQRTTPNSEAMAALDAALAAPLPDFGGDAHASVATLHRVGSPTTAVTTGGRYFGFVNGGVLPVTLAARWLSDCWDQNAALAVMSPLLSRIEAQCEHWLRELLGLPSSTVAGFVSGSSVAILSSLAAARYRQLHKLGWDVNAQGLRGAPALRLIAGRHAHATVLKALALLGLGHNDIEWVDVDAQGRVTADAMPPLDSRCIVMLQAGNVNSGAFDDFRPIGEAAQRAGAWVHIDGAFGLWAAASNATRALSDGIELAQSWSIDAHKTLNTPYDGGMVLCSDREALVNALQASGGYILYGQDRDGMLYTPEMSRRGRAIELWAALHYLGRHGVDALIAGLCARAREFAALMQQHGFVVLNEVVFNQVLVSAPDARRNAAIAQHVQDSGECWAGTGTWKGETVIRLSVCSWATTHDDLQRSARAFAQALAQVP